MQSKREESLYLIEQDDLITSMTNYNGDCLCHTTSPGPSRLHLLLESCVFFSILACSSSCSHGERENKEKTPHKCLFFLILNLIGERSTGVLVN